MTSPANEHFSQLIGVGHHAGGQWLPELKQLAGGADDWQLPGDKPLRIDWNQV